MFGLEWLVVAPVLAGGLGSVVWGRRRIRGLREEITAWETGVGSLVERLHVDVEPGPISPSAAVAAIELHIRWMAAEGEARAEDAARGVVAVLARSVGALVGEQQRTAAEMLERHEDPKVVDDVMTIDHGAAQLGRRAQVLGVLAGTWPGVQREPAAVLDVVRGGAGRIRDYQRVRFVGEAPLLAVSARVVEPLALALAELLDNAARHSQPSSTVDVTLRATQTGVAITIDDAGMGLTSEDSAIAARLLAPATQGAEPDSRVRLTELRNPPRLGWAAVGVIAARYGFTASVAQDSPYGGVRAVVHIPQALLVAVEEQQERPVLVPLAPPAGRTGAGRDTAADGSGGGGGLSVLPRRRRSAPQPGRAPGTGRSAGVGPGAAASLGAFVRGTRRGQQHGIETGSTNNDGTEESQ
ncbi:ATP-binding protein [Streptomyces sp. G-5]|uniref:ATP-binding protein n=1 Tax=Streptomyces sp. G-5 TaxID=2977231 RepID=UPI0021CFCBAD|nr:ATP-binding protein [Streptomyces sp. G-5]MCU4750251.1 ATP-binding protein [Streptomyces sp. G-5]